jgi:hypothetical protein
MKVNRRAFLQVMAAAAAAEVFKPLEVAGKVQFDPLSKLWVPKPEDRVQAFLETAAAAQREYNRMSSQLVERVLVERIGLLDDLASEYAGFLADRHQRDNIVIVSDVEYRTALADAKARETEWQSMPDVEHLSLEDVERGHRKPSVIKRRKSSRTGLVSMLVVEEEGTGEFSGQRTVDGMAGIAGIDRRPRAKALEALRSVDPLTANPFGRRMRETRVNLTAPISHELRPGTPFTDDTLVGVGIHRPTGLMVRLIQSQNVMDNTVAVHAEVAGGHWSALESVSDGNWWSDHVDGMQ